MKVTDSKTHRCDIVLEDITEEEHNLMFLEGLKVLVKEARDGNIGDYIVLPYDQVTLVGSNTTTIEIPDEDADALVQIGAVSIITRGMKEYIDGNDTDV